MIDKILKVKVLYHFIRFYRGSAIMGVVKFQDVF